MVAVVFIPILWASDMTSSHLPEDIFFGLIFCLTRSTRISAPPPGSESRPAFTNAFNASEMEIPADSAIKTISGGDRLWILILYFFFIAENIPV